MGPPELASGRRLFTKREETLKAESPSPAGNLLFFFGVAFLFSWLVWLIGILASNGRLALPLPNPALVLIGAHGPLVAALSLSYREGGWTAVKALLRAGFAVRIKPVWWASILLLPVLLCGLAVWANVARSDFQLDRTLLDQPWMIVPTFLLAFFLLGSFQEEFGWRGYALPRMLARWNPLIASLILGAVWGVWHLPLFLISGASQSYMSFGVFFSMTLALGVLFTWFYLRTGRNLFSALLLHTAINSSLSIFPPLEQRAGGNQMALTYLMLGYLLVALVVVIGDRSLWLRGPQTAAPEGGIEGR